MPSATECLLFLRHVPLFQGMAWTQLRQLTPYLELARFRAGEVIFAEGERGQQIYIIMSGRVRIMKAYGKPGEQILATLAETDFFGDMGILEGEPHGATAVADEATEVLCLGAETFQHLLRQYPSMVFALGRELSARVRHTTQTRFWDA
jgi:CRP-like cAMP-binding protein